jgi:PEP-CTERM motif
MFRKLLVCAALVAGSAAANAGTVLLNEGFDDFNNLPDWYAYYLSSPPGESGWFPGNTGVFDAQAGAADSYIAASYTNAGEGGNVDTWLITPLLHSATGELNLSFATRSEGAIPGDNLEVFYNASGTLDNLDDWHSLGSIGSYPSDWSFFNFAYTGAVADVRFAFRYTVTDTSVNGDYIGLDSITVKAPEPGTLALMALGILLTPLAMRRRRARI